MKTIRNLIIATIVGLSVCTAQEGGVATTAQRPLNLNTVPVAPAEPEKRFDLNFTGGVPQNLVDAIEKATGMPLNAIIPEEHQTFPIPALKLRNVTVPQVFEALSKASRKTERRGMGPNSFQQVNTSYGFFSSDQRSNANSIWYFVVDAPAPLIRDVAEPQPTCRFWQLESYLERLKVEDITTAIETGWKMLGVNPMPKLSFHKDTKLLIAVGQQAQLETVDQVLRELTPARKEPKYPAGEKR